MTDSDSSLNTLRAQIDEIDRQIVVALKRRWDVLAKIAASKSHARHSAVDVQRETELRERWRTMAEELNVPSNVALTVLGAVLSQSRRYVAERLDAS